MTITQSVIHVDTERTWRGGEEQVFQLAGHLKRSEFNPVIAAPMKSPLLDRAAAAGMDCIPLAGTSEFSLSMMRRLIRGIRRFNAVLLHVHTSHGLLPAAMARTRTPSHPKVIYSRRTDFHLKTKLLNLSRKKYLWGADTILSVSDGIRNVLISDGIPPERIQTVYSGIDLKKFQPGVHRDRIRSELGLDPGQIAIGMVAALVQHKDPLNFVSAARLLAPQLPDTRFFIAGAGKLREEIDTAIRTAGLQDRIRLLGFRTDIPELLSGFDMFTITSEEEGLCTSILDAMAMHLPVVATRAGGIPEAVADGETGLVVPVHDPVSLADAWKRLALDPDLARQMGDAGRRRVETVFRSEITAEKTLAVYRSLTNKGSS